MLRATRPHSGMVTRNVQLQHIIVLILREVQDKPG